MPVVDMNQNVVRDYYARRKEIYAENRAHTPAILVVDRNLRGFGFRVSKNHLKWIVRDRQNHETTLGYVPGMTYQLAKKLAIKQKAEWYPPAPKKWVYKRAPAYKKLLGKMQAEENQLIDRCAAENLDLWVIVRITQISSGRVANRLASLRRKAQLTRVGSSA